MSELRLRGDAVAWRELEGEIVALDVAASEYLAINRTGTAVWRALARGVDYDQLVGELASRFRIDEDRAARDLDAFLDSLRSRGLLDG